MNKIELAEKIATENQMTKKAATEHIEIVLNTITKALIKEGNVDIFGFGKFSIEHKNARSGRNPKTGEHVNIPAKNVPKLKFAKKVKDMVNNA